MISTRSNTAILLFSCNDKPGIIALLSDFIFQRGGNILEFDQHVDRDSGAFFARVEWELASFSLTREEIGAALVSRAGHLLPSFEVHFSEHEPKLAIWVGKQDHCLVDLLWRQEAGELLGRSAMVVSNHDDLGEVARRHGVPFHFFPIEGGNKIGQESKALDLMEGEGVELVVLAKYMQVLSADFLARFPRVINIHHSFLPAFVGANPYHRAAERGVKIIGATAHYVTPDLDAGPIIAQDVVHVTHRDTVKDMIRKGRDIERMVLARAVRLHLEHRVLVFRNRTVVFGE